MSAEERLKRERKTIQTMIAIYCHDHHATRQDLCPECSALSDYAMQRIAKCPFKQDKPTCAKCPIHCYKADMRAGVRRVMRYAGPRMLLVHPILTIRHFGDEIGRKQADRQSVNRKK